MTKLSAALGRLMTPLWVSGLLLVPGGIVVVWAGGSHGLCLSVIGLGLVTQVAGMLGLWLQPVRCEADLRSGLMALMELAFALSLMFAAGVVGALLSTRC